MERKTPVVSEEDIRRQKEYCAELRALNAQRRQVPLAYVDTYGCQQNEADSELLRGMLTEMGYEMTDTDRDADLIVINTCAIREHAEQRVFGNLGALTHTKRRHPEQKIFLCGCMAGQTEVVERIRKSYPHVNGVFSTHHLWQFPELLYRVLTEKKRQFFVQDEAGSIAEGLPMLRDNTLKSWVSIMYGCNNFCTYCIVPYVRGRERKNARP